MFRLNTTAYNRVRRIVNDLRSYQVALSAFREANTQCANCGTSEKLEVDHIVPMAFGGDVVEPSNLQMLCTECHYSKSQADIVRYESRKQSHIKLWRYLYENGRAVQPRCRYCGKEFTRQYRSITVYCSDKCKFNGTKSKEANKLMYQKRRDRMIEYVNRRRREHPEVREYQRVHAMAKRRGWTPPKQSQFTYDKEKGEVVFTPEESTNGSSENQ